MTSYSTLLFGKVNRVKWQNAMDFAIFKKLFNLLRKINVHIYMYKLWHALEAALEEVGKLDTKILRINKLSHSFSKF